MTFLARWDLQIQRLGYAGFLVSTLLYRDMCFGGGSNPAKDDAGQDAGDAGEDAASDTGTDARLDRLLSRNTPSIG